MAKAQADISTIKWDNLNRVLNEFADFFIQRARDYLAGNGSYATGNLGDTMQKIIEIEGTHFSVSIELASYWEYVNDGRKPGKFPPPYRIQEWISVKPITPYALPNGKLPTVKQLSYLIGRKISLEGTQPQPFFYPAKEEALAQFELAIDLAIDADISDWIIDLLERQGIYDELFKMF